MPEQPRWNRPRWGLGEAPALPSVPVPIQPRQARRTCVTVPSWPREPASSLQPLRIDDGVANRPRPPTPLRPRFQHLHGACIPRHQGGLPRRKIGDNRAFARRYRSSLLPRFHSSTLPCFSPSVGSRIIATAAPWIIGRKYRLDHGSTLGAVLGPSLAPTNRTI